MVSRKAKKDHPWRQGYQGIRPNHSHPVISPLVGMQHSNDTTTAKGDISNQTSCAGGAPLRMKMGSAGRIWRRGQSLWYKQLLNFHDSLDTDEQDEQLNLAQAIREMLGWANKRRTPLKSPGCLLLERRVHAKSVSLQTGAQPIPTLCPGPHSRCLPRVV
jgi:hypothetical protein